MQKYLDLTEAINHFYVTGVTEVSRCSRHSAHLHREHRSELVPVKTNALQSRTVWFHSCTQCCRGDTQCPSRRGGTRRYAVCRGHGQRRDSHQESLSTGFLRSASHHVPERLQPRSRCSSASQPQTAWHICSIVLCVHWSHYTFLHRGKCDSRPHFLLSHSPSRVQ